jgi:hypothetical protein
VPADPDSQVTAFTAGLDRADAGGDAADDEHEALDPPPWGRDATGDDRRQ